MIKQLLSKLYKTNKLTKNELETVLKNITEKDLKLLSKLAIKTRTKFYQRKVYLRGLLEISNFCTNDCLYCGINCHAKNILRYRLAEEEIMESVHLAISNNIKTIVLQGGEDPVLTDEFLIPIIKKIKSLGDIAVTLSLGVRSKESYQALFNAGATRYLLRHETANPTIFQKFHPRQIQSQRINALYTLKEIGYQTGAGFIIGLEDNNPVNYLEDLLFLQQLNPQMIGIGPFIPANSTVLANKKPGSIFTCKVLLGIIRLLFPKVLLPATTALATLDPQGYLIGLKFGCNVIMPNITPLEHQDKYTIYDNKHTSELINQKLDNLASLLRQDKWQLDFSKGDYPNID